VGEHGQKLQRCLRNHKVLRACWLTCDFAWVWISLNCYMSLTAFVVPFAKLYTQIELAYCCGATTSLVMSHFAPVVCVVYRFRGSVVCAIMVQVYTSHDMVTCFDHFLNLTSSCVTWCKLFSFHSINHPTHLKQMRCASFLLHL
jgi:hypothetical protein